MRKFTTWAVAIVALLAGGLHRADAAWLAMPLGPRGAVQHIRFERPTLAPMAYTQFCLRYAEECRPRHTAFRGGPLPLTAARWAELRQVNASVNAGIDPERNEAGLAGEAWLISPARGDCNDYAVTKRHELLDRGWPSRALLLSEVVVASGEHHLVLVVRTSGGDVVLDNLTARIRPWSEAPYRWVRIQSPGDARLWATVAGQRV
jgi:predicted transglutaminase-like cysteine proteinase